MLLRKLIECACKTGRHEELGELVLPFISAGVDKDGLDDVTRDIELCKMQYGIPIDETKVDTKLAGRVFSSFNAQSKTEKTENSQKIISRLAMDKLNLVKLSVATRKTCRL